MSDEIVLANQKTINSILSFKPLTEKEFSEIDTKEFVSVDDYLKKKEVGKK